MSERLLFLESTLRRRVEWLRNSGERDKLYVSKITQEVNGFDNVILEICDEPSLFTPASEAGPWVGHLLEVVHNTEARLPNKHLVAQEVDGGVGGPIDFANSPLLSVIVGQYVWGSEQVSSAEMGGLKGLDYEYEHNKPIEFNETPYYPFPCRIGDPIAASRVEAWEFIVERPIAGASASQASNTPCIIHHIIMTASRDYYVAAPGRYAETLVVGLPGGTYKAEWIDPASGFGAWRHDVRPSGRQ